jgi:hypothetical protein
MSLTVTAKGGNDDFPNLEKGMYEGALYQLVDLGTMEYQFGNEDPKPQRKVRLTFEITKALNPEENKILMEDGRPFVVSESYTYSLHEKSKLRMHIESWNGESLSEEDLTKGVELESFLGKTAKIEVDHTGPKPDGTGGGKPKIKAIREPAGGSVKVATKNEQTVFELALYCDEFRGNSSPETKAMCDVFDTLPQWIQDTIEESFELKAAKDSEPEPRPASTAAATDNLETISEEGSQGLKDDEIPF